MDNYKRHGYRTLLVPVVPFVLFVPLVYPVRFSWKGGREGIKKQILTACLLMLSPTFILPPTVPPPPPPRMYLHIIIAVLELMH